eukprot:Skav227504  [mRNA]  locus=scaffold282:216458:227108:+ [translate_table: standard]
MAVAAVAASAANEVIDDAKARLIERMLLRGIAPEDVADIAEVPRSQVVGVADPQDVDPDVKEGADAATEERRPHQPGSLRKLKNKMPHDLQRRHMEPCRRRMCPHHLHDPKSRSRQRGPRDSDAEFDLKPLHAGAPPRQPRLL